MVLMAAHDLEKKGLSTVLQAMQQLPEDVHLLCTQDRERTSHWESKVKSLGLSHRVHWLSKSIDLDVAYSIADVLVHPTKADVYGMVLIEAMSHDLPVICTPAPYCGAAWSWMHKKQAWLLQSPEDVRGLTQGVIELRQDKRLRSELIQAGKLLVNQQNWEDVAQAIEDLLIQSHRNQTHP